ncbi:MAG: hypothetical protein QM758_25650 [Armatimonas sp.]
MSLPPDKNLAIAPKRHGMVPTYANLNNVVQADNLSGLARLLNTISEQAMA